MHYSQPNYNLPCIYYLCSLNKNDLGINNGLKRVDTLFELIYSGTCYWLGEVSMLRLIRIASRSIGVLLISALTFVLLTPPSYANSTITWSEISDFDTVHDGDHYNPTYDLEYLTVATWSDTPAEIYFYIYFKEVPKVKMFNDGLGSYAAISLDYNADNTPDIYLFTDDTDLNTDRTWIEGSVWDPINKTILNCELKIFANIREQKPWVGFAVSKACIKLPSSFGVTASASYSPNSQLNSYDYAVWPLMRITLPGAAVVSPTNPDAGTTHQLPITIANSSKSSLNFDQPPTNLSALSNSLIPSIVTVRCEGSGTGWSTDIALSQQLVNEGYKSLIVTNHHVIEDCISSKQVNLVLSNGSTATGRIISWNKNSDVAGIATTVVIPPLQWIGSSPKQGWWVGVIGSPLGQPNILTTGIISSLNSTSKRFTITAAINPGNSGGPVFDNTGRVIGLATSKAVLSSGQLAEGFGNAHGVPLLCGTVVTCQTEADPWNARSKFPAELPPNTVVTQPNDSSSKKVTTFRVITCTKGNLVKRVKAVKPKCPTGYKKKK